MTIHDNQPVSKGKGKNKIYDGVGSESVTPPTEIIGNIDFIISHFKEPIWPRTVSTRATHNSQILIFGKEEAIRLYQQSNFIDCRINAYGDYTD